MGRQNQREKAGRFRSNMRALIENEGWTQPEAAKQLGLDYVRLRKLLNDGLANVTETNRPELELICRKFGITNIDFLWVSNLKPRRQTHVVLEDEQESVLYQLTQLLRDDLRDKPAVERIRQAIKRAFDELVCGMKETKERARGGSYVDNDTTRKMVHRNRRLGGGRKAKEND